MINTLYNQKALQKLLFVTTMWPTGVDTTKEGNREREYEAHLQQWKDKGATLLRFDPMDVSETGQDPFTKMLLDGSLLAYPGTGQTHASRVVKD